MRRCGFMGDLLGCVDFWISGVGCVCSLCPLQATAGPPRLISSTPDLRRTTQELIHGLIIYDFFSTPR